MWTQIAIGASISFVLGVIVTVIVHRLLQLLGATITSLTATCVAGSTDVNVQCTVTASGCMVAGVFVKVYDDGTTTPPNDPTSEGADFIAGNGPLFDFNLPTPGSSDADVVAVWPVFSGAPASRGFGPCTTTSPNPKPQEPRT